MRNHSIPVDLSSNLQQGLYDALATCSDCLLLVINGFWQCIDSRGPFSVDYGFGWRS